MKGLGCVARFHDVDSTKPAQNGFDDIRHVPVVIDNEEPDAGEAGQFTLPDTPALQHIRSIVVFNYAAIA